MGMNVVVTGAGGYLGSRFLAMQGVRLRRECWRDDLRRAAPRALVHFAARQTGSPQELREANVEWAGEVVREFLALGGTQIVSAATYWQYLEGVNNSYASSKQAFEDEILVPAARSGASVTSLVLFETYGPQDPRPKVMNLLKAAVERGERAFALGPGDQLVNFTHADDVARAFGHALQEAEGGLRRFLVKQPTSTRLRDWLEGFVRHAGWDIRLEWGTLPVRATDSFQDITLFPRLPGWEPLISPEVGWRSLLGR